MSPSLSDLYGPSRRGPTRVECDAVGRHDEHDCGIQEHASNRRPPSWWWPTGCRSTGSRTPTAASDWRPSPGGLVTAFEPVMRSHEGAWVGWPGAPDEELEPFDQRRAAAGPGARCRRTEVEDYYEGFSNATLWPLYHDVIAPPEFHREWWDAYVAGQPALRRPDRRDRRPGCRGLGAGLPAPARAADAAEAAARPADRVLPAHPVPAHRALRPAALAGPDPRGPARRRPGRVPAARRRVRTSSAWSATGCGWRPSGTRSPPPTAAR